MNVRRRHVAPGGSLALFLLIAALGGGCRTAGEVGASSWTPEDQYKRRGLNVAVLIDEGRYDEALRRLHRHLEDYPGEPEFLFLSAAVHARKGEPDVALGYAREAVAQGLPVGWLQAGPRDWLAPLEGYAPYRAWLDALAQQKLHGPLLGNVTDRRAAFWVRTADEAGVQVVVRPLDGGPAVRSPVVASDAAGDFTAVAVVEGLRPATHYAYRLVVDGREDEEEWTFRTFPRAGVPARFEVGFGGGGGYTPWNERIWDTIAGRRLDAFLMMGDNVYIDHPERPAVQRYTYYRRQSRPEFQRLSAATPLFAIWDDHDFTVNDGWGGPDVDTPAWKVPVWRVFRENWNNPAYGSAGAPGCWFDFSIADVDFFMLDGRYYRTDPEQERGSMLGPVQKRWLFERLRGSEATFKVIVSPVPWAFGTKPGSLDTWEGYANERAEIFGFLEEEGVDGVVLLSADRHRSDVWKIERPGSYDLFEFESSRLTNVHKHRAMPGALFSYNGHAFGHLSFDTARADPEVTYRIVDIDGEVVHSFTVRRSMLQGAAR